MQTLRPRKLTDGSIMYPKRGWEPPPPIPGYIRKSHNPQSADAWVFIPVWNECKYRKEFIVKREGCQCETMVYECQHKSQIGKRVNTPVCESCKLTDE